MNRLGKVFLYAFKMRVENKDAISSTTASQPVPVPLAKIGGSSLENSSISASNALMSRMAYTIFSSCPRLPPCPFETSFSLTSTPKKAQYGNLLTIHCPLTLRMHQGETCPLGLYRTFWTLTRIDHEFLPPRLFKRHIIAAQLFSVILSPDLQCFLSLSCSACPPVNGFAR